MEFRVDPRGDLPPSIIQPTSFYPRRESNTANNDQRRFSRYDWITQKPKDKPCYDWIFSSASNTHIAVDLSAFKKYTPFKSYVLTVADQRKIPVYGIGEVELKIRRQAGSKESNILRLENVLHVPSWLCNILSDVYFVPAREFTHQWTQFGVNFQKRENDTMKPWGFTETFCGLDRIVLARKHRGRSPMLEDKDREVFSINVTWPQSQRDRWEMLVALQSKEEAKTQDDETKEGTPKKAINSKPISNELANRIASDHNLAKKSVDIARGRSGLTEIPANISFKDRVPAFRASSLKAYNNARSPLKRTLAWRKSTDQ